MSWFAACTLRPRRACVCSTVQLRTHRPHHHTLPFARSFRVYWCNYCQRGRKCDRLRFQIKHNTLCAFRVIHLWIWLSVYLFCSKTFSLCRCSMCGGRSLYAFIKWNIQYPTRGCVAHNVRLRKKGKTNGFRSLTNRHTKYSSASSSH